MKILVTGATGMVGGEVIREAIKNDAIEQVTALVRNQPEIQNPKLKVILQTDFSDYSNLTEILKQQDAIIWCLGVPQAQVTEAQYHVITYDYTVAFAKAMQSINPDASFIFVSGAGADPTEKSRVLFARVKGKAENALLKMNFKKLFIARPAGIQPVRKNPRAPFAYKIFYFFYPLFKLITPNYVITSAELADALLNIALHGADKIILDNKTLKTRVEN